jgi:hypothetical protein
LEDTKELVARLQSFSDEFPDGKYAEEARTLLELKAAEAKAGDERRRQETEAWVRVAASAELGQIEAFLSQWPRGHYAIAARARIAELDRIAELNRAPRTRRHAVVLGVGVIVGFLLGAGTVAWTLGILPWGERVKAERICTPLPPKPVPVDPTASPP